MADDLKITNGSKHQQYQSLIPQIEALINDEPDVIANLANVAGALKEQFSWLWVGFYLVRGNELVLGPFQGPVACTRIQQGRGVCGTSWQTGEIIIVPDVEKFPGHIACSALSKSEIVLPVKRNGKIVGVLDADSENLNHFDETDKQYLQEIIDMLPF